MTALFITTTGAEVGGTSVVVSLIGHLRQLGHRVEAIKPIVSGFDPTQAGESEPAALLAALGFAFSPEGINHISPWRFRAAASPDLAASRENRTIDVDQVVAFCQNAITQRQGVLLIEGVGGIMVPLEGQRTSLDVMMALRLPLILVTGTHLGAVSHTLTALDSLFRRDLNVLATIVAETPGSTAPLNDVVASIGRFTEPVIGVPQPQRQGAAPSQGSSFARLFGSQKSRAQSGPKP